MELKDVFRNRRSVRRFKETKVEDDIIQNLLESASLAPETDSCNYYFGVITDSTVKDKLASATHYADWVKDAPVIFVCCGDISHDIRNQSDDDYGVVGNKKRYSDEIIEILRNHPDRTTCKTLLMASPVYIAAQHLILSAVDNDLRACIVDFMELKKINEILNLPEHITAQVLVPVGYPDETPRVKNEFKFSDRIFYNKW